MDRGNPASLTRAPPTSMDARSENDPKARGIRTPLTFHYVPDPALNPRETVKGEVVPLPSPLFCVFFLFFPRTPGTHSRSFSLSLSLVPVRGPRRNSGPKSDVGDDCAQITRSGPGLLKCGILLQTEWLACIAVTASEMDGVLCGRGGFQTYRTGLVLRDGITPSLIRVNLLHCLEDKPLARAEM